MGYPQFKTIVLTSMFISVLFLTGCGKKEETKVITNNTNTPAVEQKTEPTNESTTNETQNTSITTPSTTTNTKNTTSDNNAGKAYSSTFQSYKTPAGDEEIKVTATIDGQGVIKNVELAYITNTPKSKVYQDMFSAGIAAQVVGKSIKDVHVGVVNGSSLTAEGFNKAIDQIGTTYYAKTN